MENSPALEKGMVDYGLLMGTLGISVSRHLIDEHFTCIWANEYYYRFIHYTKEEYEARFHNHADEYFKNNPEGWKTVVEKVKDALRSGEDRYEAYVPMKYPDGTTFWVKMQAAFTDEYIDGCRVAYTTMTDVTEMMKVKLDQAVTKESIPGFVVKYRIRKDRISLLEANDRFIELIGINREEPDSSDILQPLAKESREYVMEQFDSFRRGDPFHFAIRAFATDGSEIWFQLNGICVDHINEDPVYTVIFVDVTDLTEQKRLREKLEERTGQLEEKSEQLKHALENAEKANRAKTDFFSHMSHDIRTPMNAIVGMVEIASAHLEEPEKIRNCLQKIALSSQHLLGLINDVLDMSRIESGRMTLHNEEISLAELMENIVTIIRPDIEAKRQKFDIRLQNVNHEYFSCDALRLRQILVNILSNATKFTPEYGCITFEMEETASGDPDHAEFIFRVSDTGIGMNAEFLEHIFDAFAREKDSRVDTAGGSGLGMAITRELVHLLGGTIEVESQVGEGSTFRVHLSLKLAQPFCEEASFSGMRVLIVDDDPDTCEYMVQSLRQMKVEAEYVTEGTEVIGAIDRAHREKRDYNAVILDWRMPGQNGLETAKVIRGQEGEKLPLLIVSAYDWNEIEEEAGEAGINGFLNKPVFRSRLGSCLRRYVLGETVQWQNETKFDFSGRLFLLAEDNALNREIAVELLTSVGAVVETADNGAEAVERFRKMPENYYDLILMDIQMPVMNGYTATRSIRALQRKDAAVIPIIAMSADAFAEDIEAAKKAGMNGHIAKPLDFLTMGREIRRFLTE